LEDRNFTMTVWPNNPASGNVGFAPLLVIERYWPGVPEPERWAVSL